MRKFASLLLSMLSCALVPASLTSAAPAAETHIVDAAALQDAIDGKLDQAGADREAILTLLDRPQVGAIASDAGLDLRRAKVAVETLSRPELASVANQARQLDAELAGQGDVRISTTAIIIGLLVLIVLILVL